MQQEPDTIAWIKQQCRYSTKNLVVLAKYPIDDILPIILEAHKTRGKKKWQGSHIFYADDHPINMRVASFRLVSIALNPQCVICGLQGQEYQINIFRDQTQGHFNLYGLNKHGHYTLLTRDHVIPKSRGGKGSLHNSQTLCTHCNGFKADKIIGLKRLRELRKNLTIPEKS